MNWKPSEDNVNFYEVYPDINPFKQKLDSKDKT